jgi:hypothetical protein
MADIPEAAELGAGCSCGAKLAIDCSYDNPQTAKYRNGVEAERPADCLKSPAVMPIMGIAQPTAADLPADLASLIEEMREFVRRFVVLNDYQAVAIALWIFHTYAIESAETTPYMSVTSAEKRSGKTRLLEVLELLVRSPQPSVNISDAALFRSIHLRTPTVIFDEIDAIFGPKARDREDLRGMLNAGYRRGAVTHRMGGANNTQLEEFNVFCAKVFAGIGELPDTIRDRAIRIRLERRTRDEEIQRFRRREVEEIAAPFRESFAALAAQYLDVLAEARPALPDDLDDRAQDVWEPLLAIADLAGSEWPILSRRAAVALSSGVEREDDSLGVRLLRDVHDVFERTALHAFKTSDLISELALVEESPWGDWHGKTITAQGLSKLLKPFRIKTMSVWVDDQTVRGYKLEQFTDAFARVLGVRSVSGVRSGMSIEAVPNAPNAPNACPTGEEEIDPLGTASYDELIEMFPEAV